MHDVKALALDGGGIRCIIQGVLLKEIPFDFDIFAGTSGGSINATFLAMGYTADDIVSFYSGDEGRKIFKKYRVPFTINPLNTFMHNSSYDPKNIYGVLTDKLGNAKLKDVKKDLYVTAYDLKSRKVILFTNKNPEHQELYLRDIVAASAAAPMYFMPHVFDKYVCIDGGMSANNPALCLYGKIKNLYKEPLIVSIGAGSFETPIEVQDMCINHPTKFLPNLLDCFMDGNADAVQLNAEDIIESNYVRLQISLGEQSSALDNVSPENIKSLINITQNAIKSDLKPQIDLLKSLA